MLYKINLNRGNKVIFLGDSFTFGQGLSDKETIASIVCEKLTNYDCINLGIPGSGTYSQYKKLKSYLIRNPNMSSGHIIHLVLASTTTNFAGNDISDTFWEIKVNKSKTKEAQVNNNLGLTFLREISKHSNLVGILRLKLGKTIPSKVFLSKGLISLYLSNL